jgi:hypothetical protein
MSTFFWDDEAGDQNLSTAKNWTSDTVPGASDTADFDSVHNPQNPPLSLLSGSISVQTVFVDDNTPNHTNTPEVQLVGGSITAANEQVGVLSKGNFALDGGTNAVTGTLTVGTNAGSAGNYELTAGTLTVGKDEVIGFSGDGKFDQSGGANNVTGGLFIGVNAGNTGSEFLMRGGTLTASTMTVGGAGKANFDLSNGVSVSIGGVVNIAGQSSGQAALQVRQGATFTASGSGMNSTVNVGAHGNGSMQIQSGGILNANLRPPASTLLMPTGAARASACARQSLVEAIVTGSEKREGPVSYGCNI